METQQKRINIHKQRRQGKTMTMKEDVKTINKDLKYILKNWKHLSDKKKIQHMNMCTNLFNHYVKKQEAIDINERKSDMIQKLEQFLIELDYLIQEEVLFSDEDVEKLDKRVFELENKLDVIRKRLLKKVQIGRSAIKVNSIREEYMHIEKLHGERKKDWIMLRQSLLVENGKKFDQIYIELKDGTKKDYIFLIDSFYGKRNKF